jgi:ribonuclease HI
VVLISPGPPAGRKELSGAESDTTNNRMELTAAWEGLRALTRPARVSIVTDSKYLKNAFTNGWIDQWQSNGWRTAARKPVKNENLWRALIEIMVPHQVQWRWVRGHTDDPENNRCDELAVAARLRLVEP